MKTFFLVLNNSKDGVIQYADTLEKALKARGAKCLHSIGYLDMSSVPKDTECIISLGGDGTIMRVARDIAGTNMAILGINMGHLGYLTSVSKEDDIENLVTDLIEGNYSIEKRMILQAYALKSGIATKKYLAINELVVTRILTGKTIQCKIKVNNEYLNLYNSDGIIISTPTGSTAYNLSAGGPIVETRAKVFILTPICPHALNLRSIVLSSDSVIDIEIIGNNNLEQVAVFDGENTISLSTGDHIIIKEAKTKINFIKLNKNSFMDNLRNKMRGM